MKSNIFIIFFKERITFIVHILGLFSLIGYSKTVMAISINSV